MNTDAGKSRQDLCFSALLKIVLGVFASETKQSRFNEDQVLRHLLPRKYSSPQ
jgi:hypothetical protein